MKYDRVYIQQILDSIGKIEVFVESMSFNAFLHDVKTQSAVILQLMLIGEVAKRISQEAKSSIDLPWKEISGFRDRAIHNYYEVDLNIVWDTITADIPALKKELLSAKLS